MRYATSGRAWLHGWGDDGSPPELTKDQWVRDVAAYLISHALGEPMKLYQTTCPFCRGLTDHWASPGPSYSSQGGLFAPHTEFLMWHRGKGGVCRGSGLFARQGIDPKGALRELQDSMQGLEDES